jgi:hypothetical protein
MKALRIKATFVGVALMTAAVTCMATAAAASAFSEPYGFFEVGNNGFVQSAGAHTFFWNNGAASKGGRLACQLFQKEGAVNEVEHGNGACTVIYTGGQFVWARVYNQAGFSQVIGGEAGT